MAPGAKTSKSKGKRAKQYPLSRHRTGQWYKKIHGKFYYFGANKEEALKAYYKQATHLHGGKGRPAEVVQAELTVRDLCNLYLEHQHSRIKIGEISAIYIARQRCELRSFAKYIGPTRPVQAITTLDLQDYRAKLIDRCLTPNGINSKLRAIKVLFHWALDNQVIGTGPNLRAVKPVTVTKRQQRDERRIESQKRQTFTPEQIQCLLEHADSQMQAIIWLGINCAFGCTDVADLRWDDLDLEAGTVDLPRSKTGVARHFKLWPETIEALRQISRQGPLVFYTTRGNSMVGAHDKTFRHRNRVTDKFRKILNKSGLKVQAGTGFYTLRRTAATIAAQSGDVFAVQGLLGHTNTRMASVYVQSVKEQTDRATQSVHTWLVEKPLDEK